MKITRWCRWGEDWLAAQGTEGSAWIWTSKRVSFSFPFASKSILLLLLAYARFLYSIKRLKVSKVTLCLIDINFSVTSKSNYHGFEFENLGITPHADQEAFIYSYMVMVWLAMSVWNTFTTPTCYEGLFLFFFFFYFFIAKESYGRIKKKGGDGGGPGGELRTCLLGFGKEIKGARGKRWVRKVKSCENG